MKFVSLVFCFIVAVTAVSGVRFRNCKSKAIVDFKNIQATGCNPSPKSKFCVFKKNTVAHLKIPFIPKTEVTDLKAEVEGIIAGIPVPFPLNKPEACGKSFNCPLVPGKNVTYLEGLPVKSIYPTLKLRVVWKLKDQLGQNQVCIVFPVSLEP